MEVAAIYRMRVTRRNLKRTILYMVLERMVIAKRCYAKLDVVVPGK